ncbi:MAG: hypothetical protein HY748_04555 [Elusimicrobia bacterium]|nr:hypothetical protein [Elusimicrobiota bacterium]
MLTALIVAVSFVGSGAGFAADGVAPLAKKDPLAQRAGLIQPERVLGARIFRFPAGLDTGEFKVPAKGVVVLKEVAPATRDKKRKAKPAAKLIRGQLGAYIRNNPNWLRAVELINDPRFVYVDSVEQEMLKAEYAERGSERTTMLPKADGLDAEDVTFAEWKRRLDIESDRLDKEIADYNNQVAYHNSICNPAPDEETYLWCIQNKRRLDAWKAVLLGEIDAYNREAERYNREQADFVDRWNAFVDVILAWEAKVKEFIQKMEKALIMPDVGWCKVLRIVRDPTDNHVILCKFLCNINGVLTPVDSPPQPTGKPCIADEGGFFPIPPSLRASCRESR